MAHNELPQKWVCPSCHTAIDMSASLSSVPHSCACGRYAIDWDRVTGMLRVLGPIDRSHAKDGMEEH